MHFIFKDIFWFVSWGIFSSLYNSQWITSPSRDSSQSSQEKDDLRNRELSMLNFGWICRKKCVSWLRVISLFVRPRTFQHPFSVFVSIYVRASVCVLRDCWMFSEWHLLRCIYKTIFQCLWDENIYINKQ